MCRGLLQSRKSPRSNFIVHYRARADPRSIFSVRYKRAAGDTSSHNRHNLRTPIAAAIPTRSATRAPPCVQRYSPTATISALQSQRPLHMCRGFLQSRKSPRSNFSVRYSACGDLDPTATTRLRLSASGTVLNSAQLAVGRGAQASLRFKPPCSFSRQVTIASSYAMLPFVVTRDAGPGIGLARNFWSKRTQPKTLRQPFANRYRGTYRCLIRSPILPSLSRTERPSARSPANAETSIHH